MSLYTRRVAKKNAHLLRAVALPTLLRGDTWLSRKLRRVRQWTKRKHLTKWKEVRIGFCFGFTARLAVKYHDGLILDGISTHLTK